jgi:OPT oligopeptide transporter protein
MPISSRGSFDNTGGTYNVSKILNPDSTINLDLYRAYSPLFLSTTFAVSYGLSFASITATLTHTFLYFRKQIWIQSRRAMSEQPDIHARLMSCTRSCPSGGMPSSSVRFLLLSTSVAHVFPLVSMFVFGVISIKLWPTQMPVWAFVLALIIAFVYVIPIDMIQAITNQQVGLNVITELIIGYTLPCLVELAFSILPQLSQSREKKLQSMLSWLWQMHAVFLPESFAPRYLSTPR